MQAARVIRPIGCGALVSSLLAIVAGCSDRGLVTLTPPGDSTRAGHVEPALLFEERFDDANLAARGWYDLPSGGITSVTTAERIAAGGGVASLQVGFPQGRALPQPLVAARHGFRPTDAVYVRYWIKHSSDWLGSDRGFSPRELSLVTTTDDDPFDGPASTHLTAYIEESFQPNGGYAKLSTQDVLNIDSTRIGQNLVHITENRAVSGCNGEPDDTSTTCTPCSLDETSWCNGKSWTSAQPVFLQVAGPGYKGDWHEVEAYFKLNSIANGVGQRDGIARYWIDGTLVVDRTDLVFRTAAHASMAFDQLILGPDLGTPSSVAQTLWFGDLVVMTGPP